MQAIRITRSRVVTIPIDVVWQLVEPVETLPAWLPLVERADQLSGQGLGRTQRVIARWGHQTAEIDQEVIAYQPPTRLSWKHVAERINGRPAPRVSASVTFTIALQSVGPGTRVLLESEQVPASLTGALLLRLVSGPRVRRAFDHALNHLAAAGG